MNKKAVMLCLAFLLALGGMASPGRAQEPAPEESAEPTGIEAKNGTIKINFPEMDLENVLKNFSAITKKSFILDQVPKGQIRTIGPIGPVEVPRDQALRLFILIMDINGYVVVKTSVDGVYKVVRKAEAGKENIEMYPPGTAPEPSEQMVTRFIKLRYVSAADMVTQMTQMAGKDGGQVIAYPALNMLIIMDSAINIDRMVQVLRILDVPSPEPEMEIVMLKNSVPSEIVSILTQIYQSSGGSAPTPRTVNTRRNPRTRRTPPTPTPTPAAAGDADSGPKLIAVDRINAIIVIGEAPIIMDVKETIAKLDVDAGLTGTIHVYYVQNAEATELAATLAGLSGGGGGLSRNTGTSSSRRSSSRSSSRNTPNIPNIPGAPSSPTPSAPPSSGGGTTTANISGLLTGDISITADEATNSLIVVATPHDWAVLRQVIRKLDIPRRQVFVEAVLIELSYSESKSAGTSIHGASPLENDGLVLAGTGFNDVSSLGLLSSIVAGGGSLALPSGITMGALGKPIEVEGTDVSVPSAGVVMRLLASYTDLNVLSTPTILTTDNEEASIEVGQKIPVPSGTTYTTGGLQNTSISRETVGIKLQLTPHINESDNIRLDIFTEISSASQSSLGIDVNTLGVTTSIKTAETSVIVKDSQTIVIGGMMDDRQEESETRVPFLGDVPVLGWLFKSASASTQKTNLIILLTPHIVRSDEDVRRVNEHIEEGYEDLQDKKRGDLVPDWDKYFDSQMNDAFTNPSSERVDDGEALEWEWSATPPESNGGEGWEEVSP